MRKVEVLKKETTYNNNIQKDDYVAVKTGLFHQWTQQHEYDDKNIYAFPVAIVELEDGRVELIDAELIRFIDHDND